MVGEIKISAITTTTIIIGEIHQLILLIMPIIIGLTIGGVTPLTTKFGRQPIPPPTTTLGAPIITIITGEATTWEAI